MKKHAKQLKVIASLLLVAVLLLSLVSCGGGAATAEDASGTHGTIAWTYTKENKTLTLTGSGEMANFENGDAVVWKAVRSSVEKVVFSGNITTVGNYAFYMMFSLKEVSLPAAMTTIGDYAFGYAEKLENLTVPAGVTAIGKGAFEGCRSLRSIFLPATVTTVGERAFAYCYSMQTAMITGMPTVIGSQAFKNCTALERLTIRTDLANEVFAADAFLGAKIGVESATRTDNENGSSVFTVKYVDESGAAMAGTTDVVETVPHNESRTYVTTVIPGYTADKESVSLTADGTDHTETVTYKKNAETEAPQTQEPTEEEDKPITAGTIVSIVIMVVVLIGIGVGAFLLIRSDKKTKGKNTTTVRKDRDGKKRK